jgi:bifunctional non-homologous end joining protein LigD
LPHLTSGAQWTVATVGERLAEGNAPWADYPKTRNALAPAMKKLGFKVG